MRKHSKLQCIFTWHIKSGTILWKTELWKPKPFSPVHRALKFSDVFGTIWEKSSIVIRPNGSSSTAMVKYTTGLVSLECPSAMDICEKSACDIRLWQSVKVCAKELDWSWVLNFAANCSTLASPSVCREYIYMHVIDNSHTNDKQDI